MPLVTPLEARRQVRGELADDDELLLFTRAAERAAQQFLNRNVYETDADLTAARTAAGPRVAAAYEAWRAAYAVVYDDERLRNQSLTQARVDFLREEDAAREMRDGILINEDIKVAMLLLIGHFFLNREAVTTNLTPTELPLGVRALLQPYRVGLGI